MFMENTNTIVLELRLTRRKALVLLTLFFLAWRPGLLGSETLVMTTYYPAPYGGYARLLTTGKTILARDNQTVFIGRDNDDADPPKLNIYAHTSNNDGRDGANLRLEGGYDAALEFNTSETRIANPVRGEISFFTNDVKRLTVKEGGDLEFDTGGNLIVRGDGMPASSGGTGHLIGLCKEVPYSLKSGAGAVMETSCPADYPRPIAKYGYKDGGGECPTPIGYMLNAKGGDAAYVTDSDNWVAYYPQGCSGIMLCCRIGLEAPSP